MNIIVGNDISLRPITKEDTAYIIRWRNTKFVRDNFLFRETFTEAMHLNWLKTKVEAGKVIQYIICLNDGTPIGSVYYRDIDLDNKSAEFGVFIGDKNSLGRGYGFEATSLFINYGIEKLGLKKVLLRVIKTNRCAEHVYEKVGFVRAMTTNEIIQPSGESIEVLFMELNSIRD